jgi:hypothetical protein
MPFSTLARRYGLIIYWAAFAALTVRAGHDPGFAPSLTAYPWKGVALTVGQLAIAVAILYAILRPRTFRRSWGRLGTAFLFVLVLFAFTLAPTDMPGY